MATALQGMRVLEHCTTTSGAFCAKLLSDLGAEVVKVEAPVVGDPARRAGPFPPNRRSIEDSGRFHYLNTGKRSVALDGALAQDQRRLAQLVAAAHVLIDDEVAGPLAPLVGDGADAVVWCSITPFGLTGPSHTFKAHHLNIAHAGGEGHVLPGGVGWSLFPDRPPTQIGSEMADFDAGATAAVAVIGAYLRLVRTGQGQRIDVSSQESQLGLFRTRMVRFTHDGTVLHQRPSPYTSAGGMFACVDGYVQILGPRNDSWAELADVPDGERFRDDRYLTNAGRTTFVEELNGKLGAWCGERTKKDVVSTLGPLGFAVGAYAVPQDLVSSPQFAARRFFQTVDHPVAGPVVLPGAPYQLSATPVQLRPAPVLDSGGSFSAPGRSATVGRQPVSASPPAPLAGVRVLDFTWAIAGPYATMLLALLGAEVIRVESSKRPDVTRTGLSGRDYGGLDGAPDYNTLNLNKRSFQVDLTQPEGLALVRRLVPLCDVVVDNFRPGVMSRFGLAPEALLADFPSVIVASSSGNGSHGPEALNAGLASIFAAMGGVSEQTGYPDAPPTLIGESPDFRSGNFLAVAILAALVHRDRSGQGQCIDLSSTEVMTALAPDAFLAHSMGGEPRNRNGNRHPVMAPHGVYPCQGEHQWISVAVSDELEWAGLCSVLGRLEWGSRYGDPATRKADEDAIDDVIARWARDRSSTEAFEVLQAAGVPSAPSFTNADLASDRHLAERGAFVDIDHPVIGVQHVPGAPWQLSDTAWRSWRHAPLLGEGNRYVLHQLLGMSDDEVTDLGDVFS